MRVGVGLVERLDILRQMLQRPHRVRKRARHGGRGRLRAVDCAVGTDGGARPARKGACDGHQRIAVFLRTGRFADDETDGGIHLVHRRTHLTAERNERFADRVSERLADGKVLRRPRLERRRDLRAREGLSVPLRKGGEMTFAETGAVPVQPASPRERVVVLDADELRMRLCHGADLGGEVRRKRFVERTLLVVFAGVAGGILNGREIRKIADRRRAPP